MLSQNEISRYSRHLLLPEIGIEGQTKLKEASVLVIGVGGLGSPLTLYLAAAGVGRIGIIDFDRVEESNLQRQVLYGESDQGCSKVDAARRRLLDLNPLVQVDSYPVRLDSTNALDLIAAYDVVADGTDNFATRYLVNDACVLTGTPNVYASIYRFEGQVSVFGVPGGPCYRCIYPDPPPPGVVPSCAEGGVLGVLPGVVGSVQATEVIKHICGIGDPLVGRLLLFDALSMKFTLLRAERDPSCPVCGDAPTLTRLIDYDDFCGDAVFSEAVESITANSVHSISDHHSSAPMFFGNKVPEILPIDAHVRMKEEDVLILDVRTPSEFAMTNIGGTLLPLNELNDRMSELDAHREKEIIVVCRSGARSAKAVRMLQNAGYEHVANLRGGLIAWSQTVDSSIPRY